MNEENIWGSVQKGQVCPKDGSTLFIEEFHFRCPLCGLKRGWDEIRK